jgi:hypothetical protein
MPVEEKLGEKDKIGEEEEKYIENFIKKIIFNPEIQNKISELHLNPEDTIQKAILNPEFKVWGEEFLSKQHEKEYKQFFLDVYKFLPNTEKQIPDYYQKIYIFVIDFYTKYKSQIENVKKLEKVILRALYVYLKQEELKEMLLSKGLEKKGKESKY